MKYLYIIKPILMTCLALFIVSNSTYSQDLTPNPASINFPSTDTGNVASDEFTLTNTTSNFYYISDISFTGTNASEFFQTNNIGPFGTIDPMNESMPYNVNFEPLTSGNKSATMVITYNEYGTGGAPEEGPVAGTVEITLTGSSEVPLIPVAEITDIDFGTNDIFVDLTESFTVSNTGNTDLVISNMFIGSSEEFTLQSGLMFPITIAPEQFETYTVNFTPQPTAPGPLADRRQSGVTIESNDPNSPTTNILESDILLPQIEVQNNPFEFLGETVGETKTLTVDVQNTGDGTLVLSDLYFSGAPPTTSGDNDDFAVTDPASLPFNIAPNSTFPVEVTFTPSGPGTRSTFLRIETVNSDALSSIFTRGVGQEAGFSGPANLDFGDEDPDNGLEQVNFTIINTGASELQLSSGEITGTDASDFTFSSNNNPVTLNQNQSYSTQITFNPTSIGDKTATLTYTSNAPNSPHVIPLTGRGVDAFIELSETTISFDDTNVGSTSASTVLIISNAEASNIDLTVSALNLTGDASDFTIDDSVTTPFSVAPGNSVNVPITFNPTAQGNRTASLSIVSNDDNSPATVSLSGVGLQAQLQVNRNLVEFRSTQIITNTRTELLTISNNGGNTALNINNISLAGEDADAFTVQDITYPFSVAPNEEFTFQVTFAPQTRTLKTGILTIETDAGNSNVALMGKTKGPKFSKSGNISFGTLNLNETKTASATVNNIGESNLIINNVTISGANAADFQLNGLSFPITIPAGASQEISVIVSPSASGTRTASLNIASNDAVTANQTISLTANVTDRATVSFASNPFTFPQTNAGETTFSLIPVTNTGSQPMTLVRAYVLASDNLSIFRVNTYEDGSEIYPLEIAPGETKNVRFRFSPDGNQDSYATTAILVTALEDGPTTNFDFTCGNCNGFGHRFYTTGGSNRPLFSLDEALDEEGNTVTLSLPNVSIGRTGEMIVNVTNTGTLGFTLSNIGFAGTNNFNVDYANDEDSNATIIQPGESLPMRITFAPQGDIGIRNGTITIRSRISDGINTFTDHVFDVTSEAVEPEEVAVGGLVFEADNRTLQPDGVTWLMQGNVHAGKLEYSGDVLVDTAAMTVTSVEDIDIFITDVPQVGDFGGDRVLLQSGMINQTIDNTDPIINAAIDGGVAGVSGFFTMVGLPVEISSFKLIDETVGGVRKRGIELGGSVALPAEVFGEDANITLDRIRIDDVDGVNVMGSAEIAPELQILKTFQLRNASINFDTFTNSFGGSAEVKISLVDKEILIAASIQIINGGLDSVELEIEVDPGIPIATTGFSLAGGNGFIRGIQQPPLSLGLGVDIVPTVSPIDLKLDNFTVAYTFGTSLSASGTIQLYNEDVGGGSVKIKTNGLSVAAFVNLYDVFKGNASMLVENRLDTTTGNNKLFFEATANLSVTIPTVEVTFGCIACEAINNFLPLTIAEVEATFNNTSVKGKLTVAEVLELAVAIQRQNNGTYRTNFNANLGIFNLSFFNGQVPNSFNSQYYFEDNEELQLLSYNMEGQSLVIPASGHNSFAPTNIPFTLDESYRNIIVRVQGTTGMPAYTLILPDNTEITPANAESFGYLATTYEVDNKAFYILQNTPVGEYNIRIDDGDTYEIDIYGAEFAPELEVTSVTQDAPNDMVTFTWTDEDLDSDANISFYYDIDDKGGDGNLIVEGISENDSTDSFTFDTSNLKSGTYFIYGIINDDTGVEDDAVRVPTLSYGPQSFVIERDMGIDETTLIGELNNNIFELSWSSIPDAQFYNVYITEDAETVTLFSDNQNVGLNSSFDFTEIQPGRTYNFGVTAVKTNVDETFEESNLSNIITFEFISPDENNLPRITTTSLPNRTDACVEYVQTITTSDVDTGDTLTLSLAIAPEGMTLSGNTISWTPTVEQLGQNQVVFEVNDGNDGIVQKQLIIAVLEADGDAPTPDVETLANITEECNASLTAPTATDDCQGTVMATTTDETVFNEQGTYQVTWVYTDNAGNEVEQIQNVTIQDTTAPTFDDPTLPADTTREANTSNEYTLEDFTTGVTFTENCSATIAQSPDVNTILSPGIYDITITVTDIGDNTDVHIFELTVEDNVLGVDEILAESFSLYPNPTQRFIMISNPNRAEISTIDIYNLNGKLVKRVQPNNALNDVEIDTSNLSTGMYLMKINTDAGQTVKTFLKE